MIKIKLRVFASPNVSHNMNGNKILCAGVFNKILLIVETVIFIKFNL